MNRSAIPLRMRVLIAAALLAIGLSSGWAQNTPRATDVLARQADAVIVGHVASLVPQWDETHTRIRTQVTINVSQGIKGTASGSTLTLIVPGGELDGVGELYSDTPVFHRDEDVVVFAQRSDQGLYRVAGGLEGKYTVVKDQSSGKQMISERMTLGEFTSELQQAIGTKGLNH